MSTIIPIVSKDVKAFNDLNQITKKCFNTYFIFRNGFICTIEEYTKNITKGTHVAYNKSFVDKIYGFFDANTNMENKIITFISDQLFQALKEKKKLLKSITIDNNIISIIRDTEEFVIGYLTDVNEIDLRRIDSLNISVVPSKRLSMNKFIDRLIGNELISINEGEYKARITKELLPVLKPTSNIYYTFENISKDRFKLIIGCDTNEISMIHSYTCVKF